MRTIFNLTFGVIKFTFKAIFWFIGIIFMLVLGSCPDGSDHQNLLFGGQIFHWVDECISFNPSCILLPYNQTLTLWR